MLDEYYMLLEDLKEEYPERAEEFEAMRTRIGNGQKVMHYTQAGLMDPYLIARKRDFENKIIAEVEADPDLKENYGHVWDAIKNLRDELKPIDSKLSAYRQSRFLSSAYFNIADDIIEYAKQMKLPEDERSEKYKNADLDSLRNSLYPEDFDEPIENLKLQIQLDYIRMNLGDDNEFVTLLSSDLYGEEAAYALLKNQFWAAEKKLWTF